MLNGTGHSHSIKFKLANGGRNLFSCFDYRKYKLAFNYKL